MSERVSALRGAGWTLADRLSRKRSVRLLISMGSSSRVPGRFSSGAGVPGSDVSLSSSSRFSKTSALESCPNSSETGAVDLASGIAGMPETWVVLALLRGDEAVEGGDSILVNEREVCSGLGLLSRGRTASSDDMVFFNVGASTDDGVVSVMQDCTRMQPVRRSNFDYCKRQAVLCRSMWKQYWSLCARHVRQGVVC